MALRTPYGCHVLSTRRPTGISFASALRFKKDNVEQFFNNLTTEYSKYNSPPRSIYVNETGLSVAQSKVIEVVGRNGKGQILSLTSAERGSLDTLVTCMSVSGQYIPPLLVFSMKSRNYKLIRGAPCGIIYAIHPSNWIQA